jgi:hypothetical protein
MESKTERRTISKEMCELIDRTKEKINDYAWEVLHITDAQASRLIVKKYLEAGLDK